jgi:hypothetical protein
MALLWIFLLVVAAVLVWAVQRHGRKPPVPSVTATPAKVPPAPAEASQGPGTRSRSTAARWIPPGEPAEIAGFSLPQGMLYVGSGLRAIKEWAGDVEPALLDPRLPVGKHNPDFEGRQMSYWPSYSTIPPASRAAYLRWLAGGRTPRALRASVRVANSPPSTACGTWPSSAPRSSTPTAVGSAGRVRRPAHRALDLRVQPGEGRGSGRTA